MNDTSVEAARSELQAIRDGQYLVRSPAPSDESRYPFNPLALAGADLDPLFQRAARVGTDSAWWQHVPFAHWVVNATTPRVLVELGTGSGVSYSAFCEAVLNNQLPTRCHAVDTWRGDEHAGYYNDEVFDDFRRFHDVNYSKFSTLLRMTFDEALHFFADDSIDLLHIDGFHSFNAVKHDFESWRRKLSHRGVVMFHDINVRERNFGVWQYWEELRTQYPSFEFAFGYGLGVIAVGEAVPAAVRDLCRLDDPTAIGAFRDRFALIGQHWVNLERLRQQADAARAARAEADHLRGEIEARSRVADDASLEVDGLRAGLRRMEAAAAERVAMATAETTALRAEVDRLTAECTERGNGSEALQHTLATKSLQLNQALAEIDQLAGRLRNVRRGWWHRVMRPRDVSA